MTVDEDGFPIGTQVPAEVRKAVRDAAIRSTRYSRILEALIAIRDKKGKA